MDVRFFNTFIEISKTKHFAKAAENLYITPAAVSARMKQLEDYFNAALFVRVRNNIQLTDAGERLLPFAQQMVDSLSEAKQSLAEQNVSILLFGMSPNAHLLMLSNTLSTLQTQYPDHIIKAEVLSGEQLSRQLQEHTIDFALTTEALKSSAIEMHKLEAFPMALYQTYPDTTTKDKNDYIQIEWSAKLNEQVYGRYTHLRRYKLRTNSAQFAIDQANHCRSRLILPQCLSHKLTVPFAVDDLEIEAVSCYLACRKGEEMPFFKGMTER